MSHIYESKNGTPEQNMAKVLEMLGGIETIINKNDIVIIKPNGQQIKHSMTNTNTIKEFIDQVLGISRFNGEIIIAENHHHYNYNSAGWTTTFRNGDYNLNELIDYYQDKGINHFLCTVNCRVFRIFFIAVKKVFSVEDYFSAFLLQIRNGFGTDSKVLFKTALKHIFDVQVPAFAD